MTPHSQSHSHATCAAPQEAPVKLPAESEDEDGDDVGFFDKLTIVDSRPTAHEGANANADGKHRFTDQRRIDMETFGGRAWQGGPPTGGGEAEVA